MSDCDKHREKVEAAAKKKGCVIVEPQENELFIDIDDAASMKIFQDHIGIVHEMYAKDGEVICRFLPSPSGLPDHAHIIVRLPVKLSNALRLGLQAMLGSDRLHELLSFKAMREGAEAPTLRFQKVKEGAWHRRKRLD